MATLNRAKLFWLVVSLLGLAAPLAGVAAPRQKTADPALILYDSSGPYGWIGGLHAKLLANLLGHFSLPYQIAPVENYAAGDIGRSRAAFYFGEVYNNPLPAAFLQDVLGTTKPVCWFKYNLLQLDNGSTLGAQFEAKFGFRFDFVDSSGFQNISYKGESFSKNQLDPDLGRTTILDPTRAVVPAVAVQNITSNSMPYVVHASNFWYVADSPFDYMSEEDRYLIFADLLHDILEIFHPESHRAIIRLEDVDPAYQTGLLRAAADFLAAEGVPFAVAVIPVYNDPLGYYNGGVPESAAMSQTPEFVRTLKYLVAKGGQMVMHGYTHQYDSTPNPYTGVSGDDYEFFRVTMDANTNIVDYMPVPEDSMSWAQNRINAGLQEFKQSGLTPVAWETPHYAASAVDYPVFASHFALTMQRVLYFDTSGHSAGQFFPYTIEQDSYGQRIMPENLGNIDPAPWFSFPARLPDDLIRAARKNRVVRDGWAAAFFHPYLELSYLQDVVRGIQALGYTYVPLADRVPPTVTVDPPSVTTSLDQALTLNVMAVGTSPMAYQWKFNGADITGATNTTLTLNHAQLSDSGAYSVAVTNALGSALSGTATVHVIAPFAIESVDWSGSDIAFAFASQPGVVYSIAYKLKLSDPQWLPLATVTGNGGILRVSDPSPAEPARFYRVLAQ